MVSVRVTAVCLWALLVVAFATIGVLTAVSPTAAAPYLNSSEPQCSGSDSTVVMCDDFEDGDWAQTNCNGTRNGVQVTTNAQTYAPNDGWCLNVFASQDFAGTSNFTVTGGAVGTSRAATSGVRSGTSGMMGNHGFPGNYTELWIREYIYFKSDYVGGHEKMFDFLPVNWNPGGGDIIALGYNTFGSNRFCWIPYKHQDGGLAGQGPSASSWICQNQSNGTGTDTLGNSTPTGAPITWQTGHWYYLEVHIRMNTASNFDGHYNMWMDDCGTDGTACTGPGTLRAKHNGILYMTPADVSGGSYGSATIKGFWQENWSNPSSSGTTYYDQIVVATRRIGPMGVGAAIPPAAPSQLSVQ